VVGKLGFICAPPQRDETDDRVLCLLLPSGYVKIAIENGQLYWIFPYLPLKMVISHSYVSLAEDNGGTRMS
jgi:hypothetical protein